MYFMCFLALFLPLPHLSPHLLRLRLHMLCVQSKMIKLSVFIYSPFFRTKGMSWGGQRMVETFSWPRNDETVSCTITSGPLGEVKSVKCTKLFLMLERGWEGWNDIENVACVPCVQARRKWRNLDWAAQVELQPRDHDRRRLAPLAIDPSTPWLFLRTLLVPPIFFFFSI